ncbi:MAG TPA: amidohydrolase family protein [Actinomycetes bacterium]
MIDGLPLVDVHLHPARLPTLKLPRELWSPFGRRLPFGDLYDDAGRVRPDRFDAYLAEEGVDVALLMSEYSPRVTGIQPVEDLLPLLEYNPRRFRLIANLNPHLHHPIATELERQLALGAAAVKLHPVHGRFSPTDGVLYLVYQRCAELGVPVVFHSGTSTFPGAVNRYGDPGPIDEILNEVPGLKVVLAHGGRGWWYDAAAFLALARENVWIDLSGLPPQRLPDYYARHDLRRLARKFIFGSDWPGVPGIAANARAVAKLDIDQADLPAVLAGNARKVYRGLDGPVG